MNTQSSSWYIPGEGKKPVGPFTAEQVIESWRAGRLTENTLCWQEGMAKWLPLAQVEPFASAIRRTAATAQATPPSPSIRGTPPPVRRPFLSLRLFGSLIGVSIIGVLAVVLAVVLSQRGGGHSSNGDRASRNVARGDAAAHAEIIGDYPVLASGKEQRENHVLARGAAAMAAADRSRSEFTSRDGPGSNMQGGGNRPLAPPGLGSEPTDGTEAPGPMVTPPSRATDQLSEQFPGLRTVPRFTEPPLDCSCPCWSSDGKYVMFVARPTERAGEFVSKGWPGNIWVITADGSKKWLVSNFFFGALQPPDGRRADPLKLDVVAASWSPNGGKIAFLAYEGEDRPIGLPTNLYVMKADATDIFHVTDKGCTGHSLLQWTPDGRGLLFNPTHDTSTMTNLEGTEFHPLTAPGGGKLTNACSSRDGKRLAAIGEYNPVTHGICVIRRSRTIRPRR